MFDGFMPPPASAAKRVASGVQMVPSVAGLAFPSLGAQVGILDAKLSAHQPVCLTLGNSPTGPNANGEWPGGGSYVAGLVNQAGVAFGGTTALRAACVLEYGMGSSQNKVYFDWIPGSYNLPPCERVSVSILPWGTTWTGAYLSSFAALASVSEGEIDTAHVPTVSGYGVLTAATPQSFTVPCNARAVDCFNADPTTTPSITLKDGATGTRNYSTGQWIGPTPLDVVAAGYTVKVESDTTTIALLRWYLAL